MLTLTVSYTASILCRLAFPFARIQSSCCFSICESEKRALMFPSVLPDTFAFISFGIIGLNSDKNRSKPKFRLHLASDNKLSALPFNVTFDFGVLAVKLLI